VGSLGRTSWARGRSSRRPRAAGGCGRCRTSASARARDRSGAARARSRRATPIPRKNPTRRCTSWVRKIRSHLQIRNFRSSGLATTPRERWADLGRCFSRPSGSGRLQGRMLRHDRMYVGRRHVAHVPWWAASAAFASPAAAAKNSGGCPMKSPSAVKALSAPIAAPSVSVGRMIETIGRSPAGGRAGRGRRRCAGSPGAGRSRGREPLAGACRPSRGSASRSGNASRSWC
jgi:hypothetical protein